MQYMAVNAYKSICYDALEIKPGSRNSIYSNRSSLFYNCHALCGQFKHNRAAEDHSRDIGVEEKGRPRFFFALDRLALTESSGKKLIMSKRGATS